MNFKQKRIIKHYLTVLDDLNDAILSGDDLISEVNNDEKFSQQEKLEIVNRLREAQQSIKDTTSIILLTLSSKYKIVMNIEDENEE